MVVNVTKVSQKMRRINWLSIKKKIIEWEKTLYYNLFLCKESIRNFFLFALMFEKKYKNFLVFSLFKFSLDIKGFLSLEVESYISQNIRNFLRVGSFYFLSLESYFMKYEAREFHFQKYKKVLFRKI